MNNTNINKALKKTKAGNYFGYYKSHYIFIFKRPHGAYCCRIGQRGKWERFEGYFGTSLKKLSDAKKWATNTIARVNQKSKIK